MIWRELEIAAPEIARVGEERLDRARVGLLATLREDGSPRISPVEPYLSQGELLFGSLVWSLKTRDLRRDSRCALHSAITGPDNGEPELKLQGRALEAEGQIRDACQEGWWQAQSPEAAIVFALRIERASLVKWDIAQGQMVVVRWSPDHGLTESRRSYP